MTRATRRTALLAAGALTLGLAVIPAQASPTWVLPPVTLSDPTLDSNWQQVDVNADGDAIASWTTSEPTSVVHASWRPAGGPWQAPVTLSDTTHHTQETLAVVDDADRVTVIWREVIAATSVIMARSRSATGAWDTAVPLSSAGTQAFEARIALGEDGSTAVAWYEQVPMTSTYVVRAAFRPAGGGWQSADTLSGAGPMFSPDIAIGGGLVAVAWRDRSSGKNVVTARVRSAAGVWGPVQPLSVAGQDAIEPAVAVDRTGETTVIWRRFDGTHHIVQTRTRTPAGAWGGVQDVSGSSVDGQEPDLAVDPAGALTAVWRSTSAGKASIQASFRSPGGGWTAPQTVSDASQNADFPIVTAGPAGEFVAVWRSTTAVATDDVVVGSRRSGGSGFGTPALVAPAALADNTPFGLAMDSHGDALAVARRWNGVAQVIVATPLDVAPPAVDALVIPATGTIGQPLAYSATLFDTWSPVASVVWSFGDGSTSLGASASHAFTKEGTYGVTLIATDAVGNSVTRTATTTVPAPVPAITTFKLTKTRIQALARAVAQKTKLKVQLNTASTLKVVVKSKHRHLVKGTKKYVRVVIRKKLPAGISRITIKGKVAGTKLRPDTYVLTGTAKNSSGTSPKRKVKLKVVR